MADDFYPFVDSGDPAPDNAHITGISAPRSTDDVSPDEASGEQTMYATRIAIYDDMLSTPRVVVVEPNNVRTYLEEITNTVYRCMKEQGGNISLMVIREIVENFIHAHFIEPIISILDGGKTIRFADQGPGITDKERAFEFGVTSADREMKRYIRGTGAGFPMVQQYLEAAGGAVSIEDNLSGGTVVTVTVEPSRVQEIERNTSRGAAVRGAAFSSNDMLKPSAPEVPHASAPQGPEPPMAAPWGGWGYPYQQMYQQPGPGQTPQQPGGWPAYPQPTYPPAGGWPGMPQQQAPGTMPSTPDGMGMPPSYQQQPHQFSTIPQYPYQPAVSPMPQQVENTHVEEPFVSQRGRLALSFLVSNGHAGPTELAQAYGHSGPTWSRELATLGECGFVIKRGQKYYLTELGASWISSH